MSCQNCDPTCAKCGARLEGTRIVWRRYVGHSDVTGEYGWVEDVFCSPACLGRAYGARGVWTQDDGLVAKQDA